MIIVTDIDECVLGWADGFYSWLKENNYSPIDDWRNYDSVEDWLYKNSIDFSLIYDFNKSPSFGHLTFTKKSEIYIPLLYQMNHTLIALTACGTCDKTVKYREDNINNLFPNMFSSIICVNSGIEKKKHLEEINGDIWVEDNLRNAYLGQELNYKTFIIDYHHNRHDEYVEMHRVQDWEELYNKLY